MGYNRGGGLVYFLCFARNESTLIKTLHCLFSLNLPQRMAWGLIGATHESRLRGAFTERERERERERGRPCELRSGNATTAAPSITDQRWARRCRDAITKLHIVYTTPKYARNKPFIARMNLQQPTDGSNKPPRPAKTTQTNLTAMKGLVARIK